MNQQELAQALNDVSTQLGDASTELTKAVGEINQKISDLETQISNAGGTTPEVDAALQALKDSASGLTGIAKTVDDIVPDPVVAPPSDTGTSTPTT